MPAQLIDGVKLSQQLRADIARRAAELTAAGQQPGLAVIIVGDDPASHVYVRNKVKACGDAGFHSVLEKYEADLSEAGPAGAHRRPERRPGHPRHPGADAAAEAHRPVKVIEAIATTKDVDGYSVLSAGELVPACRASAPARPTAA
jgi:methylenetetrahydrofolate dehydrogenase (NADP+)/methenyltetrahydrofolate cyclohydrolase